MAFSASAVSNHFLYKNPGKLTMLRLQRLLVASQGFWLATHDVPLFEEEITHTRGIVPSIWFQFLAWGDEPIDEGVHALIYTPGKGCVVPQVRDENAVKLLDKVWAIYGDFSDEMLYNSVKMDSYDEISLKLKYKELLAESVRSQEIRKLEKLWEIS